MPKSSNLIQRFQMVAKIKINETGDCIFTEQDAIDLLYTNPDFDISKLFFNNIEHYNQSIKNTGIDLPKIKVPSTNLLEETKNKIDNYYKNFKKDREKEKKRKEDENGWGCYYEE